MDMCLACLNCAGRPEQVSVCLGQSIFWRWLQPIQPRLHVPTSKASGDKRGGPVKAVEVVKGLVLVESAPVEEFVL